MMLPFSDFVGFSADVQMEIISEKEPYGRLFSAFSCDDRLVWKIAIPRVVGASSLKMYLQNDSTGAGSCLEAEYEPLGEKDADLFIIRADMQSFADHKKGGLYYYHFSAETTCGEWFLSQNEEEGGLLLTINADGLSEFQLLLYAPDFVTPDRFKGGVMYQIFPDRFRKGGDHPLKKGARLCDNWLDGIPQYADQPGEPLSNDLFFGGDLEGIREKLPYLASLGVNILYLNPIFDAVSNHKYDTGNYLEVDSMFGGDEALQKLLTEAKMLGIAVILDGVFNHTGDDSLYFNKYGHYPSVGAYQSASSSYYDWYHFGDDGKYDCWWGIPILPRVDSANPSYRKFLCGKNGVISRYMKWGADGWRLDVADELDEALLFDLRTAVKRDTPDALLIGEVWEDASNKISYGKRREYFRGAMLDSVMNYPLKNAIIDYVLLGDASLLSYTMRVLYSHYPKQCSDTLMNFLDTHDTERILTVLSGSPLGGESGSVLAEKGYMTPDEKTALLPALRFAWAVLCAMPGIPCIYYGDEAGMDGYRDPFNRRPYPWGREMEAFIECYRRICRIHREETVFAKGYYREIEHRGGVILFERFEGAQSILVAANAGKEPATVYFDGSRTDLLEDRLYLNSAILSPLSVRYLKTPADADIPVPPPLREAQ